MNIENWLLFSSIALIATITPGPAILLASTHSVTYGVKKALATIFGNITGLFAMSALSVLGLSTIILYSTTVFIIVKFAGAAYLIYLGIKLWRNGFGSYNDNENKLDKNRKPPSVISLYLQGLFVALSNPKAIAFTTALFPQFIDHTQPLFSQFTILVVTFMSLSFGCLLAYSYAAENMKSRPSISKLSGYMGKAFGSAFVASGVALANASQK
ncbi:MAG: LysE family translocator [Gammaproteobacteria bacterium]|nr:LysE family translocator [Gammaproteobacteria bacterium]